MSKRHPRKSDSRITIAPVASPSPWQFHPMLISLLLLGWGIFVLFYFTQGSPVNVDSFGYMLHGMLGGDFINAYLVHCFKSIGIALWMVLSAYAWGRWFLNVLVLSESVNSLEHLGFSIAIGLGVEAAYTFLVGILHWWYPAAFFAFLGFSSILTVWQFTLPLSSVTPVPGKITFWDRVWFTSLLCFGLIFLIEALAPEIFFDALFYHLGVPNLYRLEHRIYNVPMLYANFILTVQMIYGFAITIGDAITAKLLHCAMGLDLAILFMAFGARFLSLSAGLLGAVFFFSMPLVGINITSSGMDIGWTLFQFAAILALIRALEDHRRSWFVLTGLLAGLSAACKYPALPYVPLTAAIIVWQRWRQREAWPDVARDAIAFLVPSGLILVAMFLKNYIFHHNPVYPFLGTHWGWPRIDPGDWKNFTGDAPSRSLAQAFETWYSTKHFLLHPWYITFENKSVSGFVGPLFLMGGPLLFLHKVQSFPLRIIRLFTVMFWCLWLATTTTPRYALPTFALLSLWLAYLFSDIRSLRSTLLCMVGIGVWVNFYWTSVVLYGFGGWKVVTGQQSAYDYLANQESTYPVPPYQGIDWINHHLPGDARVLFTGDCRSFYMDRHTVPGSVYDLQPIVDYACRAADGDSMARMLQADGITHIYLNLMEAVRTRGYNVFRFTPHGWAVFQQFWQRHVRLLWSVNQNRPGAPSVQFVYEISATPLTSEPPPPFPFSGFMPQASSQ